MEESGSSEPKNTAEMASVAENCAHASITRGHLEDLQMTEQGEYVSRREFEARSQQMNEKIENLRSDMKACFLHLTERMDDKFERVNGKFEEVHRELNRQDEKAEEARRVIADSGCQPQLCLSR